MFVEPRKARAHETRRATPTQRSVLSHRKPKQTTVQRENYLHRPPSSHNSARARCKTRTSVSIEHHHFICVSIRLGFWGKNHGRCGLVVDCIGKLAKNKRIAATTNSLSKSVLFRASLTAAPSSNVEHKAAACPVLTARAQAHGGRAKHKRKTDFHTLSKGLSACLQPLTSRQTP